MECGTVRDKFSPYLEGSLSSEEKRLVEQHLMECQKCAESLAHLKKTLEHLHRLEEVEPPPWLRQRIMARVAEEAEGKKGILQRLFYPLHIKLPLEAVAAVLIAMFCLYVFKAMEPEMKLAQAPVQETPPQVLLKEKEPVSTVEGKDAARTLPAKQVVPREKKEIASDKLMEDKKPAKAPAPPEPATGYASPSAEMQAAPQRTEEVGRRDSVGSSAELKVKARDESRQPLAAPRASAPLAAAIKEQEIPLTIKVKEVEPTSKQIEDLLLQLSGRVIRVESLEGKKVMIARLDSDRVGQFLEHLKSLGELTEGIKDFELRRGQTRIVLEIRPSDQ